MTKGEILLLKWLERYLDLPRDVLKRIIQSLGMRARLHHRRRSALDRWWVYNTTHIEGFRWYHPLPYHVQWWIDDPDERERRSRRFYGPGF